ncbi:MAG TPA: hypothetical protein PK657_10435 [Legionella sp.]|nr:hypothetical protein [Legionella sp.]
MVDEKVNSFFGMGWSKIDFATALSNKFKQFLLKDGVDSKAIGAIKASNPIDICYGIAKYYFNLAEQTFFETVKYKDQAERYLKLAIILDNGKNVVKFLQEIDDKTIVESATISEHIGFYVIGNAELRKCLNLTPYQLGNIVSRNTWSEEKANAIIDIIAGPPPLIDTFYPLENLCMIFSSVSLRVLTKPSLLKLLNSSSHIGYKLIYAYQALMKNIDSCESVSVELKNFINVAVESNNLVDEYNKSYTGLLELSNQYLSVFQKLQEKALKGYSEFQTLVGQLYRGSVPFTSKNIEEACKFLLLAALNGEEMALTNLLEMDAEENHDLIKYSLGKIYLERLDFDKAFDYFSQVTSESKNYDDALFECGNIKYCIFKDKAAAFTYFSIINSKKEYSLAALVESSRSRLGPNHALTDIYSIQKKVLADSVIISGIEFPINMRTAPQLFGRLKNKSVSLERLENVWQNYQEIKKSNTFKRGTCNETLAAYEQAKSPIYNDIGRYRVLSDYALDKKNQHREFYKVLIKEFGKDFFQERINNSSMTFQPSSQISIEPESPPKIASNDNS